MKNARAILWKLIGCHAFRCSPHLAYGLRRRILRAFGARIAGTTKFRRSVRVDRPWNLEAGALTVFGDAAQIRAVERIAIGERCVISQYSILSTSMRDPTESGHAPRACAITIEDDCWIATDALVMPGAIVRAGTVVGARALVEGELPGWSIAVGEPAVVRGQRVLYAEGAA